MKNEIQLDRLWVFAPVSHVVTKVEICGEVTTQQLTQAILQVVNAQQILKTKITLEGNHAFYEETEKANVTVQIREDEWRQIVREQERIPFDLENGEFIRFFLIPGKENIDLLMIAHHLAGDGISYTYLVSEIMRSLDGEQPCQHPIHINQITDFPKNSRLHGMTKWMMRWANRKWRKTGRTFTWKDRDELCQMYWAKHATNVLTYTVPEDVYQNIKRISQEEKLKINSIITGAFIRAAKLCGEEGVQKVGHAVSIRENGFTGMGNYAAGISIKYGYNDQMSFVQNVREIQKLIYKEINQPSTKYFLLQFLGQMAEGLYDGVYFASYGDYTNKIAGMFSSMFGYTGQTSGMTLTNLTKLPIQNVYGKRSIKNYVFIPPMVLNVKQSIGVATLDNQLEICYEFDGKEEYDRQEQLFETAKFLLKSI